MKQNTKIVLIIIITYVYEFELKIAIIFVSEKMGTSPQIQPLEYHLLQVCFENND